jgi:O-antigen/teichoic acid export membrane protein
MCDHAHDDLALIAKKLVVGSGFRLGGFILARILQIIRIVVFARLFTPADIGVATLATTCISIMSLFGNFGFAQYIIRGKSKLSDVFDTAFTLSLIFGLVACGLTILLAPMLSRIFSTDLNPYIRFLAFMTLIVPLRLPSVYWEKELRFWHPSVVLVLLETSALLTSILLELCFHKGVWSLVTGSALGFGISVVYIWAFANHRPRIGIRADHVRPLMSFGAPFMVQGINSETMTRGDTLLVGAYAGASQLAFYNFAWQVPMIISSLTQTVDSLFFPVYAKIDGSQRAIIKLFNLTNKMWSVAGSLFGFAVVLYADRIVDIMYGSQWEPVVPLLRVMALSFIVRFCSGYSYDNLALIRGRTGYMMKWGIVNTVLLFTVGQLMIANLGPIGGAWYWMLQAVILGPAVRLPLIVQELGTLSYVKHIWQPVVAGLAACLVGYLTLQAIPSYTFAGPSISLLMFLTTYGVVLLTLDRQGYHDIVRVVKMAYR